ncbi:hypothetical protein P0Y35_00640 [Kiritimatiellaeota bacterium B1221]|nr:hypothetical protein [Kiritimatiellaeota bacterium B1221]
MGPRFSLYFLLSLFSVFGCVRVEADKEAPTPTRLIVTRDNTGVKMQFQSVEGLRYSVYYRDSGVVNDEWKLLSNAKEIEGTGELILISDASPRARYRKYRIQSLVPVKRKDLKKR